MAIDCSPQSIVTASVCFECIPQGQQLAVQTYLLAQISATTAGTSLDPGTLANAAKCFWCGIPDGEQLAVQNYLLCQIASAVGA